MDILFSALEAKGPSFLFRGSGDETDHWSMIEFFANPVLYQDGRGE